MFQILCRGGAAHPLVIIKICFVGFVFVFFFKEKCCSFFFVESTKGMISAKDKILLVFDREVPVYKLFRYVFGARRNVRARWRNYNF